MTTECFDVMIVGGGGAGMTAALYTSRAKLSTLLFEKMVPGGQIAITDLVENYPGFPEGITGPVIATKMEEQARRYGTQFIYEDVRTLRKKKDVFEASSATRTYEAKTVILAAGASFRRLGIPGESELTGRGVSYCATCDGAFFRDKEVVVIGGGDSALQEGLFLTRFASKVTIIHRRDQLRAGPILQERAHQNPKMVFCWNSIVERIKGAKHVESVEIHDVKSDRRTDFKTDGVFVFIGHEPNSLFMRGFVELNEKGYIVTNAAFETSLAGVFAAGEIRAGATRQLVSACGEGCSAALAAQHYLENL